MINVNIITKPVNINMIIYTGYYRQRQKSGSIYYNFPKCPWLEKGKYATKELSAWTLRLLMVKQRLKRLKKASKAEIHPIIIPQQYMREADNLNMQSVLSILSNRRRERELGVVSSAVLYDLAILPVNAIVKFSWCSLRHC